MSINKSRKWLLTINNPLEHGMLHEQITYTVVALDGVLYWCMCDEIGDEGTPHTHIYIQFNNPRSFNTIKNAFPAAHIDNCYGTPQENRNYIRKEGKYAESEKSTTNLKETFFEFGECPEEHQGARNDVVVLYDLVKDGATDYEIIEANPNFISRLDTTEKVRQILRDEQFKNQFRDMTVSYIYGLTGSGKTRYVMDKYGYTNVYRVTDYSHPFDGYKGQDVVVFEEFRSSLRIQDMLNYLDGYPLELPCRYNNKIACFTKVYLITNIPLSEQFKSVQKEAPETWKAFLRRIHSVYKNEGFGLIDESEYIQERISC